MLQKQLLIKLPFGIHGPPEKQQGNYVSIPKDRNLVKWTTMKYGYVVVESHSPPELPLSSTEMLLYPEIRTLQYIEMLWGFLQKPKKRKNLYLLSPQETFLILFLNQKQFSKTTWRRVEWHTLYHEMKYHAIYISTALSARFDVSKLFSHQLTGCLFPPVMAIYLPLARNSSSKAVSHFLKGIQNQQGNTKQNQLLLYHCIPTNGKLNFY